VTLSTDFDAQIEKARSVPIASIAPQGLKRTGKELVGPCPRCGGKDRFSISPIKGVFNCRGCEERGDVIALSQFLWHDDFSAAVERLTGKPALKTMNGAAGSWRTEGEWIYLDADEKPYLRVMRKRKPDGSKSYPQYRIQNGKWVSGKPRGPKIPYRLPELLDSDRTEPVFIVEGEKCADRLAKDGVAVTTSSEGAGKWTPDLNQYFADRIVWIIPDADEAGRGHARQVAANLHGVAREIRILELTSIEDGQDVFDFLEEGGAADDLRRLGNLAPIWESPPNGESDEARSGSAKSAKPDPTVAAGNLESAKASTFKMRSIRWFWNNRFALGKLSLIGGLPDQGKGQITSFMMAKATTGSEWPCKEGFAIRGNVLLLSGEDDTEDTVVPRLVAAGADCKRIEIVKMVRQEKNKRMFSLVTDLELLRQKVVEIGNVVLIVVDPMSAYLGVGKIDSYRTTDVRGVLSPLTDMAAELRLAIVGVMHFNKKTDVHNAMLRISDSLAYVATSRSCYVVIDDPENNRKLFMKAKNNLAPDMAALSYTFATAPVGQDSETHETITAPYVVWDNDYVNVTATEAMQAETSAARSSHSGARGIAKKFLVDMLANGPVLKNDIEDSAKGNGIAERTLFRAKAELDIVAKKDGPQGGWRWHLPEQKLRQGGD
jgi:putative DNA primase/helicase